MIFYYVKYYVDYFFKSILFGFYMDFIYYIIQMQHTAIDYGIPASGRAAYFSFANAGSKRSECALVHICHLALFELSAVLEYFSRP